MNRLSRFVGVLTVPLVLAGPLAAPIGATELLPPGFRPLPLGIHALDGGDVVVKPGLRIQSGTIVLRDGLIESVGTNIAIPADARVWDMKGRTIYAGFIEPYLPTGATNPPVSTSDNPPVSHTSFTAGGVRFFGAPGAQTDMGQPGPGYEIGRITPEFRAIDRYSPREATLAPLRQIGFTAGVIAPPRGIIRGSSSLVVFADENPNRLVIRSDVFQHIAFETGVNEGGVFPGSLMGMIAAVRQSFYDAKHFSLDHADYEREPKGRRRPEFNPALNALRTVVERKIPVMFEPGSVLMNDRAAKLARELEIDFSLVSTGQEWRRPDLARATGAAFVVPVNFPSLPKLPAEDDWDDISLDHLRTWDWAPENPALLRRQGMTIAFTTYGLSDKKTFPRNLRLAIDRGLSEDDAIAALTTTPAAMCGVSDRLGTIEPGKLANLVIVDGPGYFDPDAKVSAVWIDGRYYPAPPEDSKPGKTSESRPASTTTASPGEGQPTTPPKEEPEKYPAPPSVTEQAPPPAPATNLVAEQPNPPATTNSVVDSKRDEKKDGRKERLRQLQRTRIARSPMEGRGPLTNPPSILITNATIWTCGPSGTLTNASLMVSGGKVLTIGHFEPVLNPDMMVIDGAGKHVTPGLIDCHSHSAILGAVNESTLPSTAMVRIQDVVNSETANLYQQLAGGVTAINLLHGSANPIGGQNCVIKLRDGAGPDELIYARAPSGIKFALGENVKQSNWGERNTTRFPQSRMGVPAFFRNRFLAAQQYLAAWQAFSNRPPNSAVPPRRDLELEAIGEILRGSRLIHCHSYRQDEILAFLRTMEEFRVKVASLQHILEGYKLADEIAAHGAGASTFSDWWAYKFEVYDAIPYNGSLLFDRGVLVSFNSDSSDLARRLYQEAAKAVKYGGTPEDEALRFVTWNPARQLRIEQWTGSLEPGKDADFVLWSKSPLDFDTVCLETWIEGKKYFDRSLDNERVARLTKERDDLIAKAKQMTSPTGGSESAGSASDTFLRVALELQFDGIDRHCLDGVSLDEE